MKLRKNIGLILILIGILIFVSLMALDTSNYWRLWSTNDTGKAEQFPNFLAYWWNFSKTTLVLSSVLGAIPIFIGILIRKK